MSIISHITPTDSEHSVATAIRVVDRLAIAVALSALIVFAGITLTHLPAGVTPPHHAPTVFTASPGPPSAVSSSGILDILPPIEGWAAFAVAVVAWSVRHAIAHRWPGLSGAGARMTESQTTDTTPESNTS
jgi:hypothetical protein